MLQFLWINKHRNRQTDQKLYAPDLSTQPVGTLLEAPYEITS